MTDADTDTHLTEAYELGCSRGWDHANFVDAYGKEHERNTPDYPAHLAYVPQINYAGEKYGITRIDTTMAPEEFDAARAEFKRGWTDGRRRFHRGQYPDGTKITD